MLDDAQRWILPGLIALLVALVAVHAPIAVLLVAAVALAFFGLRG